MAGKEHQGLQIALILFVLITIALAATSFIFYKEWEKQVAVANTATQREQEEIKIRVATDIELEALKKAVGKDPDAKVSDIQTEIENLMKQYSATYPEPAQTITTALENQMETYLQLQAERVRHRDELAKLQDARKQLQAELAAANKRFEDDKNVVLAQLMEARKEYDDDRSKFTGALAAKDQKIAGTLETVRQIEGTAARDRSTLAAQLRTMQRDFEEIRKEHTELKDTDIESPDGQVTGISERQRTVWINIGNADGLRRQTTFSVFDRDVSQVTPETSPKAKIEVVRLLGPHVAEARILEDSVSNPILRNDVIFSTAFTPGQREHFAVAGLIDIDGDGTDDLERLRSIININGGELDAVVDAKGNRSGKPTYKTRFIVVGDPPAATENNTAALEAYSQLLKDAQQAGVKQISVAKFLDYVGFVGRERSVDLGRRADPNDFRARPSDGVVRESTSAFPRRAPRP